MITVVLLTLGAVGLATPAFLPRASADMVGTAKPVPVRKQALAQALAQPLVRTPAAPPDAAPAPRRVAQPQRTLQPTYPWPPAPRPRETQLPTPEARPAADLRMERMVVTLVNERRRAAGCGPVRQNSRLTTAAYRHSRDMAVNDFLSHTGSNGSTPWDRARLAGYQKAHSENVAAGHKTPELVVEAWMESPGHRDNILNCRSKAVGVGVRHGGSYGIYWTQMFGTV